MIQQLRQFVRRGHQAVPSRAVSVRCVRVQERKRRGHTISEPQRAYRREMRRAARLRKQKKAAQDLIRSLRNTILTQESSLADTLEARDEMLTGMVQVRQLQPQIDAARQRAADLR